MAKAKVSRNDRNLEAIKNWLSGLSPEKAVNAIVKEADRIERSLDKCSKHSDEVTLKTIEVYRSQLTYFQDLSKDKDFPIEDRRRFVEEASKILLSINEIKEKDEKRKRNEKICLFGVSMAVTAIVVALNIFTASLNPLHK